MIRVSRSLAGAAALLLAAGPALADSDVQSELAEMRELVEGLQQKVDAQEEQLEQQGELLEDAQRVVKQTRDDQSSLSGLAKFLEMVEVTGNVAASYAWNFNRPENSFNGLLSNSELDGFAGNQGFDGRFYPFHPDHNSFQVDQVWFGLAKPATEEGRGGFGFDLVYGATAAGIGTGVARSAGLQPLPGIRAGATDQTSDIYVHQAYVEYLAPVGDGINFKFGKWATLVGAEVLNGADNFNITHGNLYNLLQPIDHVGVLATAMAGPVELSGGVVNASSSLSSPDLNEEKTFIASAAFSQDTMGARASFIYGAGPVRGADGIGLVDFVATFDPTDTLSMWLNADYSYNDSSSAQGWGVAAAGRVGVTEKLGFAIRGEVIGGRTDFFGLLPGNNSNPNCFLTPINPGGGVDAACESKDSNIYSVTATADYSLTNNLTLRGEVRWDQVKERVPDQNVAAGTTTNHEFLASSSDTPAGTRQNTDRDQVVALVQVVYEF